jgi:hypothetical protein
MTASRGFLLLVGAIGLLNGCATPTLPVAPSVMALPGAGKPLEQFHIEDTACRQWAAQRAQETAQGVPAGQYSSSEAPQQWYDMAYLQCMYAKGNQIPGIRTGAPPSSLPSPTEPPPPRPSPLGDAESPPAQAP